MTDSTGGKGSKQRPTDQKRFNDNWELIFGKKTAEVITEPSILEPIDYVAWDNWLREKMRKEDRR